ncbi:hypothetical protein CBR_g24024 [Chara braunii]|uniref:DUF659 domain-containing protein n=1 Tax=Chara braunii TaxID=69332 RepID=A0A388L5J5_CHABU|nr:hypothetical protein CBR_g24024 [Chara braunii]|eukprot:GBG77577.1 hypothetical protein CBR_g24024 [Chara braunii]
MKMLKSCPFRTREIVHKLVAQGAKVLPSDKKTHYLLQNYRQLHNIKEGGAATNDDDADAVVRHGYEEPQPPVAAGREAVKETAQRGSAAGETLREECQSTTRAVPVQQTTITRWVDNATQKKLDIAWAEAMFRAGIAFNFLNFDTTLKLHEQVQPLTTCWDVTGCTFITNGSTDRREKPVMNFLGAGEQGAVLVATVSMDGRKKTGPALARLWEKIMREIGLQRINAICTDNAEVNKKAAQILEWHTDLAVSRIPWVPCAVHCCSLLLRDISKLDWMKGTVKRSHTIVKFIRNHHCTHSLMMSLDDSLLLLRPTEVRFGSVYMMMERLYDRRAILKQMVEGSLVGRWKAMRWSTTKLQSKADLVFFTLRSEGWWPELKKVVEVMEPLYVLLRRMDKDGTAPSNLVEYDRLMERMLAEIVLTEEQRRMVLEKVRDCMKMMPQPVHALAFLLDQRRREPKWLLDRDNALVQNALRYLQRRIGGAWKSDAHVQILSDLREFHTKPTGYNPRRKDKKMWDGDAVANSNTISPSEWWATHGGDVPELQAIAMKVMGMWSSATPAERNWSSMDLVHSKRRNRLNPSTLEKLVYIHWNMQLLHSGKNLKDAGYIDLWTQFFESLSEPEVDDGSILKDSLEEKDKTKDELVRERAFIKTPKGRIPKSLEDEEKEEKCTDDSDLDDEVWKGKTPWSEASSEGEDDESLDDDFELGIPPSTPCTTYVGRREAAQRRRERPPTTPSQCTANTTAHYNIQSDVERRRKKRRQASERRRQNTRLASQEEEEKMEEQEEGEEEAGMEQREEEMEQEQGEGTDQQEEELEESEKEQQQEKTANIEEEQQQHAPTTVYKRRKRTVEAAGSSENSPDFPANKAESQHDNLWVSRVGRKRKAPCEDERSKPELPRGRPRKNATADPAAKPKKKQQRCKQIVEDDPESSNCSEQFAEDEGGTAD